MTTEHSPQKVTAIPAMLDQEELCRLLEKSPAWAEKSRWDGSGPPFIKIGRAVRYRAEDVAAWLESQRRTSTSDNGGAK